MTNTSDEIIDFLQKNRVSTTEVADCLGKQGAIPGVSALNDGHYETGNVSWLYTYDNTNWPLHEQAENIPEDSIVVIDTYNCDDRAIFGDIVAKYLILYRQSRAVVVNGLVRDVHRLKKENWPIWCTGRSPVGCFNVKPENPVDAAWEEKSRQKYESSIAVCDDSGVVIIPKDNRTPDFIKELERIEQTEDTWYECIDRRKWSTFKTICQKAYLDNPVD